MAEKKLPPYYGEYFSKKDGGFNPRYLVHFQILSPPDPSSNAIWSKRYMGGAEYEGDDLFERTLADTARRKGLVTGAICAPVIMMEYDIKAGLPPHIETDIHYICAAPIKRATEEMLMLLAENKRSTMLPDKERVVCTHRGDGLTDGVSHRFKVENRQDLLEAKPRRRAIVEKPAIGAGEIYQPLLWFIDEPIFRKTCQQLNIKPQ